MGNKRKFLISLLNNIEQKSIDRAVEQMWNEGLLNRTAIERLYISSEVNRRVRAGEVKTKAMEQLSEELKCSYEKVRTAVYSRR
jgi:hypothetical protein